MGPQLAEAVADRDLHRLQHLHEAAGGRLGHDAGLIDGGDESRSTAVHDRNFGTVDFDGGVIDAHAAQGSQHMFGRGDQRTFAVAKNGRQIRWRSRNRDGRNFAVGVIKTGTDKNKTCIHRCRSERKTDR